MATIISSRNHPVFSARSRQLDLNRLAAKGGRPYIEARLWRAPNETDTQWAGDRKEGIVGRRERSALVNDAGRIVSKIRQYIFKKPPERHGVNDVFAANCAGEGVGIDEFMGQLCDAMTTGQWCWIQVDSTPPAVDTATGALIPQTLENKPTVFWRLWESCSVPDWCIDDGGVLRWIIVRTWLYDNSNPFAEARKVKISTLFYISPEDGDVYVTDEASEAVGIPLRTNERLPGLQRIPFVLVGKPSMDAWWFDDVENIQAQVMNYDSMHNETLTDAVYPQLVVPMALLNTLQTNLDVEKLDSEQLIVLQRELIKGRKNPFYEDGESKGTTRYIQPAGGDLKMLTEEQDRKRKLLFDMAGLALFNRETRQVQTAESKSFDQLDTNATLGNRALILQRAEEQAVELSVYYDSTFAKYAPVYNTKFDVVDVAALSQTVQTLSQLPNITPRMRRVILKSAMRVVLEVGGVSAEEYDAIVAEIDALPDEQLQPRMLDPFGGAFGGAGDGDQEPPPVDGE